MTVGRNAGGHFFRKGNQRKAIMVYLAVALSAALGGFVHSITGFGAAVVMMTILPYFFTMAVAPSVSTSICLGLTVTLAWKLRNDERVVNMERTNVRYLEADSLPEQVDAATIDVAFISLDKILPAVHKILKPEGFVVALIKPQFEAGKENVGKKGVVRDAAVHEQVINNVISFAKGEGFGIAGLDFSPIKGPEGNIEYLLHLTLGDDDAVSSEQVAQLVGRSHGDLDKKAEKTEA